MYKLLSPSFWMQTLISTLITMVCIYAIKKVTSKYNIPVVSAIAEEV